MNNKVIELLKEEFENGKFLFQDKLHYIHSQIEREIISRGFLFNIIPFENETYGFHIGKEIKSLPKNMKNIFKYGINSLGEIILIEEYKSDNIVDNRFIYYEDYNVKCFNYSSGGPILRNVSMLLLDGDTVKETYNYGLYGIRYESYTYHLDKLIKTDCIAKEHNSDYISKYQVLYSYNTDGKLVDISKHFSNGYVQNLYLK